MLAQSSLVGYHDLIFQSALANQHAGTRLGISNHIEDNQKVSSLKLFDEDRAAIEDVLDRSNGRRLITSIGDCGAEYR